MTFLAPGFFLLSVAAAAGVIALHFIVTRLPPSSHFPTVRFVPEAQAEVTTVTPRPTHLLLLLLRVLLLLAIGAAFARPVWQLNRRPVTRIVLAELPRTALQQQELRDSLAPRLGPRDVLIAFDTAARVLESGADSLAALGLSQVPGRLSPALVLALRTAAGVRQEADSIALTIVSPLEAGAWDGATGSIRALWPGPIELVRLASRAGAVTSRTALQVSGSDPLVSAVALAGMHSADSGARLIRTAMTPADSGWVREGGRLIIWHLDGSAPGWELGATDSAGAIVFDGEALVYPFIRRARTGAQAGAQVVVRWADGNAAAVERTLDRGCVREVALALPTRGDLTLRPEFGRLLRRLSAPCGAPMGRPATAVPDLAAFGGSGAMVTRSQLAALDQPMPPLVRWFLLLALVLAALEHVVRRRTP